MNPLIPLWILGAPFIGLLILSFSFKGASAMGGTELRIPPRNVHASPDHSAAMMDPVHPDSPRRLV